MITYIDQGKIKENHHGTLAANTAPHARVSPKLKGHRSSKRGPFAQASPSCLGESSTVSTARFQ